MGSLGYIAQGSAANPGASNNISNINQKDGSKSNRAAIDQNVKPASGNGNNNATINQNGGSGNISGGDGTALVGGLGLSPADISFVKGIGGNWAGITQEGNGTNTVATVNQNAGGLGSSSANFANLYQNGTGSGNKTATINQNNNSVANVALLYQGEEGPAAGNLIQASTGTIEQMNGSDNNQAELYQTHGNQTGLIQQNDNSSHNQARVDQSSLNDGNVATVRQNNFSSYNEAAISQTAGSARTATIDQIDQSSYNRAVINQMGPAQGATPASTAYITQTRGTSNEAYINQNTLNGATAVINQHDGNDSYAKITQNTTYFTYGNTNVAEIEQTGSSLGTGNSAIINQDYSANTAKLKQDGNSNQATVNQVQGDLNVVKGLSGDVALQQGTGNILTVTQQSISYIGTPFGPYTPNTASVQQIGTSNVGNIVQTTN